MSPTEFELRAALKDGEGGGVDPDRVIARAAGVLRERHARRVRIASMSAAAAVIVGVAVTGSVLLHGNSGSAASSSGGLAESSAGADATSENSGNDGAVPRAGSAASSSAGVPSEPVVAPGPLRDASVIACPGTLPDLATGSRGTGSLFTGAVEAVKVCAYTATTRQPVTGADGSTLNAIYTGASATQIVTSIASASADAVPIACADHLPVLAPRSVVIIGVSADGDAEPPIVASLDTCNKVVSNGTITHYNWTPPAVMSGLVAEATQPGAVEVNPPIAHGSPVH